MKHTRAERPRRSPVYARVGAVLLCLFLLRPSPVPAAEPDWPQIEKHALEFLQQYIRIRSINPPADTTRSRGADQGRARAQRPHAQAL